MLSLEYSFIADDLKVKYKNVTFRVTTTNYMTSNENNEYANETQIILGRVEKMIRLKYGLPDNETLLIYKLDYYFEEFLIPITEFLIYNPGHLVSIDTFENELINIKIPVNIYENEIYKYDPNSEYYNNSCYPDSYTPSQNCQDQKILNSRKIEYNKGNMQICKINCIFVSYNLNTKKVECQCPLKTFSSFSLFSEIYNSRINRTNLFFYFDDIIYYTEIIETTNIPTTILAEETANMPTTVLVEEKTNIPMAVITEEKMNASITNELTDFIKLNNSTNFSDPATDIFIEINLTKINEIKDSIESTIKNIKSENVSVENLITEYISAGGDNLRIEEENLTLQIVPAEEQNEYDNISYINLGKCEEKLRGKYNISDEYSLIIAKFDFYDSGYSIPKVEYDIYDPISKEKLVLDICNDTKIDILVPVVIDGDVIFLYNTSSDYYNDLCFPYTTEDGTDIILTDRKNEYVDNNMSLCEDNCDFSGYNSETQKAIYNCDVKMQTSLISEIQVNKEKILKNFLDIKSKINLSTMKCYKLVFSKKGQEFNIGSYVLLVSIFANIVLAVLFKVKGFAILTKKLDTVKSMLQSNAQDKKDKNDEKKDKNKEEKKNDEKKEKKKDEKKDEKKEEKSKKNDLKKRNSIKEKSTKKSRRKSSVKNNSNPGKKNSIKMKLVNESATQNMTEGKSLKKEKRRNSQMIKFNKINDNDVLILPQKTIKNENPEIECSQYKYNEYELNNLSYEEAIQIDKRTYFQYYFCLLKRKQLIIFTFYTSTDYNSRLLKISLFLFSFALYVTINALFFNDSAMHKIYEDHGNFNFLYNLPKILYSTIISTIINFIVLFLSLTEKDIVKIKVKVEEEKKDLNEVVKSTEKCLKIKLLIFFVLNFLFILFFWFYLSSFCAVYRNTQIHLFKDVSLSFALSLLYPFGLALLPGMLRIPALNDKNKDRKMLYNISKIVQLI